MFSNIYVIKFFNAASKGDIKFFRKIPCLANSLSFKIKLRLQLTKKVSSFFILKVQLNEKITLDEISYLISRFLINILHDFILHYWVQILMKSQQNSLFICDDLRVSFLVKCLSHDNIVFYFSYFHSFMLVIN